MEEVGQDQAQFNQGVSYAVHYGGLSRSIDKLKFEGRWPEYFKLLEVLHDVLLCMAKKDKRVQLETRREGALLSIEKIHSALKGSQYTFKRSEFLPIREWELALRDFAQERGLNMPDTDPRYSSGRR